MSRYEAACDAIDLANAQDARMERTDGGEGSKETLYALRMVGWVRKLAPSASEELLLAARAQHIRRWTIPRTNYPEGRTGYLKWRETLKKFHADLLGGIMSEAGYDEDSISKAKSLIVKKNVAADPEGQTLEDAACLVFLEFEFAEFASKTEASKVVDILRKTWKKMSPAARERALGLSYDAGAKALLREALG